MNLSLIPPFTVDLGEYNFRVSFSVDTLPILPNAGLREVVTCHIAQTSPIAFYAGDCVKHPKDPVTDDYYPVAKVAMKRAVAAMTVGIYNDNCFYKMVCAEFRAAMRAQQLLEIDKRVIEAKLEIARILAVSHH